MSKNKNKTVMPGFLDKAPAAPASHDPVEPAMSAPVAPAVAAPAKYVVAEGKSITSLKGILGPGKKADASCFRGGQDVLDRFIKIGCVVKSG